jgi:Zn-dependent oligopeptidase
VDSDTRRRAWFGYQSRMPANVPILEKIVNLRRQASGILGYKNWADYKIEVRGLLMTLHSAGRKC